MEPISSPIFPSITRPALLINAEQCRANIARMALKARAAGSTGTDVVFRPHFKTHQSAQIAEWFRAEGMEACTVSSVAMAEYFADYGWSDITIAFPVNPRELPAIDLLAERVEHLHLLVESVETVEQMRETLTYPVNVWIKIDCGYHRTGIAYDNTALLTKVAKAVQSSPLLTLRGLLSHFGDSYHCQGKAQLSEHYHASLRNLQKARLALGVQGITRPDQKLLLSIGDTPSCSLVDDLGEIDEMRPGNFVFYDSQQLAIGSCTAEEISAALACPIVALHPERGEVIIHGGAIHLSKDTCATPEHPVSYGLPALPTETGWSAPIAGGWVRSLSQEHGIVCLPPEVLSTLQVGDLLMILPAHSCLTLQAMAYAYTLEDRRIDTLLTEGY